MGNSRTEHNLQTIGRHQKQFTVSAEYLILPIQNGGTEGKFYLDINDRRVLDYDVALAPSPEEADWHAFFSIGRYRGKSARVEAAAATDSGFALVKQSDTIPGEKNFYREKLRPSFHFTAKTGWLNDPNGLIYYNGRYHMYYQHNPVSVEWGNMTWGHAVSTDMVHWKEQPRVLFPDAKTGACFSGAAFIDRWNQLGRKTGKEDVIVAFYLRTKIGLALAYSNDGGMTFTDYEENPVIKHEGARIDTPRPFRYEPTKRWIAPTYDHFVNQQGERLRCVGFYSSDNLKDWQYESRVEQDKWGDELCGCVDFFQLPLDGDPERRKWVMIFIDGSYIVGTFDGHRFCTLEGKPATTSDRTCSLVIQGNYYATMTWHDMPDDRRVQITWMQKPGEYPGMPFNQQMTAPSELTLHSSGEGPRLRMNPIRELESLRIGTREWKDLALKAGENALDGIEGDLFDLEVEFEPAAGSETVLELRGMKVSYDCDARTMLCGDVRTTLEPVDGAISLRILLDRASVEVYGNNGRIYIPQVFFPAEQDLSLKAACGRGEVRVRHLRLHELKSSWE